MTQPCLFADPPARDVPALRGLENDIAKANQSIREQEQAPDGFEWICSECGRTADNKADLRTAPTSCAAWAVLREIRKDVVDL